MKKSLNLWQLAGFIFTGVAGVLLHFLFEWTGKSIFVAPFAAVNESIWEHMKLLFVPMFLFAFIENKYFKMYDEFWCVKLAGVLMGTVLVPVLYYTLNGIFGPTSGWVNIAIFFASAAVAFLTETTIFKNGIKCKYPYAALTVLCVIALLFAVFTFAPPHIPLFRDPVMGGYGIV
ncbi:MAG: hypothetical protein IKB55_01245 [Clostridia bacterium]|nr:hypothetical protein [Clostridia bacterium]